CSPQTPTASLAHILRPVVVCILLSIVLMLLCLFRNHKEPQTLLHVASENQSPLIYTSENLDCC
ncbi:hypothetical protein AMECASPLE_032031, partial [Ameca splendens]